MKKIVYFFILIVLLPNCSQEQLEKLKELQKPLVEPIALLQSKIRVKNHYKQVVLRIKSDASEAVIKDGRKKKIGRLVIKDDEYFLRDQAKNLIWRILQTSGDSLIIKNAGDKNLFLICKAKKSIRLANIKGKLLYTLKIKSPARFELYRGKNLVAKAKVFGNNLKIKRPDGKVLLTIYGSTSVGTIFFALPEFSLLQKSALFLVFHRPAPETKPAFPF